MGGYGAFVWSAYGFATIVLVGLFVQSWRGARRKEAELAELRLRVRPARARPARPLVARRELEGAESRSADGR
jgi:heme exporter protein D